MAKTYYFNTGLNGKNTIQAQMRYDKSAGGYAAVFCVGDRGAELNRLFGWHIDADYFNYYMKPQTKLLVPSGRRSAKKEAEAESIFSTSVTELVREFAASAEALGAPKMEITAA